MKAGMGVGGSEETRVSKIGADSGAERRVTQKANGVES